MMRLSGRSRLAELGLVGNSDVLEGYVLADKLGIVVNACFMAPDSAGNVVLHVTEWLPEMITDAMPIAVSAVDFVVSLDTRERSTGPIALERMLNEYVGV